MRRVPTPLLKAAPGQPVKTAKKQADAAAAIAGVAGAAATAGVMVSTEQARAVKVLRQGWVIQRPQPGPRPRIANPGRLANLRR